MTKTRLDVLMTEQGKASSRTLAQRLVMEGKVQVNGQVIWKPSEAFSPEAEIQVEQPPRFVSRGGDKLSAAFDIFAIDWKGKVCADVGSSTGGFTDCMLQHGVQKVYALDVGEGILDWRLRNDERVVVMEKTNARYVEILPEQVYGITMDVSFISVKVMLPVIAKWYISGHEDTQGELLVLIKPQFEAGKQEATRGKGIIRDPRTHRRVLMEVLTFASDVGYNMKGVIQSPVIGQKGNIEFLAWLDRRNAPKKSIEAFVNPLFDEMTRT